MIQPLREFMEAAMAEAVRARESGDYAVGTIIVKDGEVVARASNRSKRDEDPTAHAEILAIRDATRRFGTRHLKGCVLYATHEPCPMCASAAVWAMLDGIVSGARMEDMIEYRRQKGNDNWLWRSIHIPARDVLAKGDPKLFLVEEFMRDECNKLFHS